MTAAVAVFGPRSAMPEHLWGLPRSSAASLTFVPRGTGLHTRSAPLSPQVRRAALARVCSFCLISRERAINGQTFDCFKSGRY